MFDFPIADAHVHLWDPQSYRLPWLSGFDSLNRRYDLQVYDSQTAGIGVAAMVYVQADAHADDSLAEAIWLNEQADRDPRPQGIVPAAPLDDGERVRPHLEALRKLGNRVKGVRRNIQTEPDDFCLNPDLLAGIRLLPSYGLSFDICIQHGQLPATIELVRRNPDIQFILDHIAKPAIKNGLLDPWRNNITQLAKLPNIVCKVSGIVTEADLESWSQADITPYIDHVIDQFGEDRVLFGSDWPVVLLASSYERWVETLNSLTSQLTPAGRRKLWYENTVRVYRLR